MGRMQHRFLGDPQASHRGLDAGCESGAALVGSLGRTIASGLPDWLPDSVVHYIQHIEGGTPIRELARRGSLHPSTVLRQVRRLEQRRDDPLIDSALQALRGYLVSKSETKGGGMTNPEPHTPGAGADVPTSGQIQSEALRVLRRLAETGTELVVARDMEMAVVLRRGLDGAPQRLAVVCRAVAQALGLKGWIAGGAEGRIGRYRITSSGRGALTGQGADRTRGLDEPRSLFAPAPGPAERSLRHMRSLLGDSPVTVLARRQDRKGLPFLSRDQVVAAERLREDFELADCRPDLFQDWDGFLKGSLDGRPLPGGADLARGASDARTRLWAALNDLGPGLADVALRCCCLLEGLESIEARMDWSARSGKIVLRIALQRLRRHYQDTQGRFAPMIG